MVVMVMSCVCSLHDPTQQDCINAMQYSVQPGMNTKNEAHAHHLGSA